MNGLNNLKRNKMPDITMCPGKTCKIKDSCYRYTAKPSQFRQSYFTSLPMNSNGDCNNYWKVKPLKTNKNENS